VTRAGATFQILPELDALTSGVLKARDAYNASPSAEGLKELNDLAKERAEILWLTISRQPALLLKAAIPSKEREKFPTEVHRCLEKEETVEGRLSVSQAFGYNRPFADYYLELPGGYSAQLCLASTDIP